MRRTLSDAILEVWSDAAERYQLIGRGLEALEGESFNRPGITMAEALADLEENSREPNAPRITDVGSGRIWLLYGDGNRRCRVTLVFDGPSQSIN